VNSRESINLERKTVMEGKLGRMEMSMKVTSKITCLKVKGDFRTLKAITILGSMRRAREAGMGKLGMIMVITALVFG